MTVEEAKYTLSQKVTELRTLLQERKVEIFNSDNIKESVQFSFNGYTYVSSFLDDLITDLYGNIKSLITLCYFNELDDSKQSLLVKFIIRGLDFENFIEGFGYNEAVESLSVGQRKKLEKFLEAQIYTKNNIIQDLKSEYLLNDKSVLEKLYKINWKGNQKKLAELLYQLERKGWIEIPPLKNSACYRTMATLFEVEDGDNLVNNFKDYFKPSSVNPLPKNGVFGKIESNDFILNS